MALLVGHPAGGGDLGAPVELGPFLNVLPWLRTNPETINDAASALTRGSFKNIAVWIWGF